MEYKTAKRMEYLPFSGIRAVMEKATKMQQAGEKVIHLEIGRPDFDTPKKIKDAAYESLNAGHVFYTSNYGTPALRKEIAKWENEHHNVNYETSEVLVTVGVGEATYASMAAFLEDICIHYEEADKISCCIINSSTACYRCIYDIFRSYRLGRRRWNMGIL